MANITKRGDSYTIRVCCGRDVNKKQIFQSMTYKPDKNLTGKRLEKELQKQAALFEEKVKSGKVGNGGNIRLVDFVPQYLENVSNSLAVTTVDEYKRVLKTTIVPSLGHLKLKDIRPTHIQKFINNLTSGEYRLDGKNKGYAPASVKRYYAVLSSVISNAYQLGMISENPCDSGKIKLPRIEQETQIYDEEKLSQMLSCLDDEPFMWQLYVHLAVNTGCRRSELSALRWSSIDFENGQIMVSKSLYKLKGQPTAEKDTKTHQTRPVSIPDYCIQLLKAYQSEQAKQRLRLGTAWEGSDFIFTQWNGLPICPTTPTGWWSDFLKKHDLPHIKLHALRHTSATLQLNSGTDIKTVSSRLGHREISTTNRYVHSVTSAERVAADKLGDTILNLSKKAKQG